MQIGDKVSFQITTYPYKRVGVIVKACKVNSMVMVQYGKRKIIFKKQNSQLKLIKDVNYGIFKKKGG